MADENSARLAGEDCQKDLDGLKMYTLKGDSLLEHMPLQGWEPDEVVLEDATVTKDGDLLVFIEEVDEID